MTRTSLETTDIFRGAFFLSNGGTLEGAYVSEDNRRVVSFKIIGKNLSNLDRAYRAGKALVNPLQLKESLNLLRETLYRTLKNNKDVAVGTALSGSPPHRSGRALLMHPAPAFFLRPRFLELPIAYGPNSISRVFSACITRQNF